MKYSVIYSHIVPNLRDLISSMQHKRQKSEEIFTVLFSIQTDKSEISDSAGH